MAVRASHERRPTLNPIDQIFSWLNWNIKSNIFITPAPHRSIAIRKSA